MGRLEGNPIHGLRWHPSYTSWNGMLDRCYGKTNPGYPRYGGRGIKVCKRWHSVENFILDMGIRPEGMQIDRIDNDGNYSPSNCRWATRLEQANNTSRNVFLEHNGERKTLAEWSRELKINRNTLKKRYRIGWPVHKILETVESKIKTIDKVV